VSWRAERAIDLNKSQVQETPKTLQKDIDGILLDKTWGFSMARLVYWRVKV